MCCMWLDAQGSPKWAPLLATLPEAVETPVLWPTDERAALLRGSPVLYPSLTLTLCLQAPGSAVPRLCAAICWDLCPSLL